MVKIYLKNTLGVSFDKQHVLRLFSKYKFSFVFFFFNIEHCSLFILRTYVLHSIISNRADTFVYGLLTFLRRSMKPFSLYCCTFGYLGYQCSIKIRYMYVSQLTTPQLCTLHYCIRHTCLALATHSCF